MNGIIYQEDVQCTHIHRWNIHTFWWWWRWWIDNTIYFGVTDVVMKFWVIPTCISKFVILFYRYAFFFLFCYNSVASCWGNFVIWLREVTTPAKTLFFTIEKVQVTLNMLQDDVESLTMWDSNSYLIKEDTIDHEDIILLTITTVTIGVNMSLSYIPQLSLHLAEDT